MEDSRVRQRAQAGIAQKIGKDLDILALSQVFLGARFAKLPGFILVCHRTQPARRNGPALWRAESI